MKTNTTAKASAKANTTTTATATANTAAKVAATPAKTEPAALSVVESYKIAAALLEEHKTTSAIKATAASLRGQYGPRNWSTIWASVKELRAKDITAAAADVRAVVLDLSLIHI